MSEFRGTLGCFKAAFDVALLACAIFVIINGEGTPFYWSVLIGAVMDVVLTLVYHWAESRRNWNREDSYWSKKEEPEDSSADQ